MNVTFHIIIDATETKKGGIICKDIYYNSIYISKHIQEIYDFDLSNISYPFYLNAEKKAINLEGFSEARKFLFAKNIFLNSLKILKENLIHENNDRLSILSKNELTDFTLKDYNNEFKNYVENEFLKSIFNNFKLNHLDFDLSKPVLVFAPNTYILSNKLSEFKNSLFISDNLDVFDDILHNYDKNILSNYDYIILISVLPLYNRSIKDYYRKNKNRILLKIGGREHFSNDFVAEKTITLDELKSFNYDFQEEHFFSYFDQFFHLVEKRYDSDLEYKLENPLCFKERLQEHFKQNYIYQIKPILNNDSFDIKKMHSDLCITAAELKKSGIDNFIISPPPSLHYNLFMSVDYYLNYNDYHQEEDYDYLNDLANEEMRSWDDETDGFWRIENDFG